jgi:phage I-like protein
MPRHRHMIPVATSAFFFVCLMLHAQTGLSSQSFTLCNDGEANKVFESLLPNDWTVTVAHARRLLIQAQAGRTNFRLKPAVFHAHRTIAAIDNGSSNLCVASAFYVLDKNDGLWQKMRWMDTSCPWAS